MTADTLWARECDFDAENCVPQGHFAWAWRNPWRHLRQIFEWQNRVAEVAYSEMQKDVRKWKRLGR